MSVGRFDPYYEWLGVQPSEQPVDYYRLLGIARFEGNLQVVERAADRQMGYVRQFQAKHPSEAAQVLSQLSLARITLTDGEKKLLYDTSLKSRSLKSRRFSLKEKQPALRPESPKPVRGAPCTSWHIQSHGIPQGPFTTEEVQERIKAKEVRADTMVRRGSDGRWMLAREAQGLFDLPVPSPPAPGTVPKFTEFEPIAEAPDLLAGPMPGPEDRSPGPNVWICRKCRWPVPKPKVHCPRCGFVKRVNESSAMEQNTLLWVFYVAIAAIAIALVYVITS